MPLFNHLAEATLDFNPDQSDLLILDACSAYYQLSGEWPPLFQIYQGWYFLNHQHLFNLPQEQKLLVESNKDLLTSKGRKWYFDFMLPQVMKLGT